MSASTAPDGEVSRFNNFGTLRLLLAALVVVSHSPEILDGNLSREILTTLFGTVYLGQLAVDGFFLISGYLIMQSFERSASIGDFMLKRVLRIYPGFIAAYLLLVLVVAPVVGGDPAQVSPFALVARLGLLLQPEVPGTFASLHFADLDRSMWTISYEFRCYLLVMLAAPLASRFGRTGYGALLAALALLYAFRGSLPPLPQGAGAVIGEPQSMVRLAFVFFVGGAFHVWRGRIRYTGAGAAIASSALILFLFDASLAEPAFGVLGGYVIFWYALARPANALSRWVNRVDPSYGLYLYAWPVQMLIALWMPAISPWALTALTLPAALLLGLLSWHTVEKPALRHKDLWKQFSNRPARSMHRSQLRMD